MLVAVGVARAQPGGAGVDRTTVGGSLAYASLWDDETHLGRGIAASGEVAVPTGRFLRVAAEAGWFGHDRDAGYLAANGTVLSLMGRASLLTGPPGWRARPFVGAGVGVARSTGTLTSRVLILAPGGRPEPGPDERRSWTLTRFAWEVHLGVRVAATDRIAVRPEIRAGVGGGSTRQPGTLEPPLLRLQGGVAIEWALR